jgi:hypothetical protein
MRTCSWIHERKDHGVHAAVFAAGLALMTLMSPAAANVAPEATVQVHVRAPEPPGQAGCTIPGITSCHDIVNSTTLTGELEFDIFVQPWPYPTPHRLTHLQTTLAWPDSWQYVRWEPCHGVDASLLLDSGTASLMAYWPDCPEVQLVPLLVGRLVMNVTEYGRLQPSIGGGVLYVDCPPAPPVALNALGIFAEAGVVCDYTQLRCTPGIPCEPILSETEVAFNTGPDGVLAVEIPFHAFNPTGQPCGFVVQTEASWLSGSYEQVSFENYVLHLTCNPVGLQPGMYATRALVNTALSQTRRCVGVTLEVAAISSAPGEDEPPREVRVSWSRLKAGYR